jgi:hypothetical protein
MEIFLEITELANSPKKEKGIEGSKKTPPCFRGGVN